MVLYPVEQAKAVLQFYRDFSAKCPDALTVYAGMISTPDGMPVVALIAGWFGTLADLIGLLPYTQLQSMLDGAAPFGLPRDWKSGYFSELSDEVSDQIVAHASHKLTPLSVALLFHLHGVASRTAPDATAFAHRQDLWDFDIIAQWTDPATAEQNIHWARSFWQAVAPFRPASMRIIWTPMTTPCV